ncbi:P-loop containing nucleoside triphosphate hydrolase protein [Desarmillaria tabescens]|uniref:Kinesin-like protein n=1 Tax=Armillaria tabescens TaxID=1929756 RepID=A0AA39NBE5_ARMTA|nr:P-loop containing nucleoside triphosphate hydrolase protein [Desarmillaria tabescens]KAK0462516.1 P-loop containing nucleoside triphosphate hydrolase protein [Desarmillaria tabescens]
MATSATLTTTQLPRFRRLLEEWAAKQPPATGFTPRASKDVVVAFRTRPPLPGEATSKAAEPGVFVAHVPGMKWSVFTLTHKEYIADLALGPDTTNEEVYQRTVVSNDLLHLALSGGVGCILAYGQTSSGKTYTMEGIESRIARDLFDTARVVGNRLSYRENEADFFEFSGKHATDLVEPSDKVDASGNAVRNDVAIHEDKAGNVRPRLISTIQELITSSLSHRRTNSHSHAVLTIHIKNKSLPYAEDGRLVLVDLAGSERHEDSKAHDKQRMKESRENNESLMNLKESVRAKAKMAAEDGFLTMLLKPIFDVESRQPSKAVIIAHVCPHIQDSIHSTNTLSYATPFRTVPAKPRGPRAYDSEDPRTWDRAQIHAWLTNEFAKRAEQSHSGKANFATNTDDSTKGSDLGLDIDKICPEGYTARNLGTLYTTEFVERCLAARTEGAGDAGVLKNRAAEVIGQLFYLIMSAKTRTRTQIMKSRKKVKMQAYGEAPKRTVGYGDEDDDPMLMIDAMEYHTLENWDATIAAAIAKAVKEKTDVHEAHSNATRGLMEAWRVDVARRQSESKASI